MSKLAKTVVLIGISLLGIASVGFTYYVVIDGGSAYAQTSTYSGY